MLAACVERDAGAGDDVLDRAGDHHFTRFGGGGYPRGDVDGDAADVPIRLLDLARMHASPHLQSECLDAIRDRRGAADGARGSVERREDAVAEHVDLAAAKASELRSDDAVVPAQQLFPGAVAELRRLRGGADDIREQE